MQVASSARFLSVGESFSDLCPEEKGGGGAWLFPLERRMCCRARPLTHSPPLPLAPTSAVGSSVSQCYVRDSSTERRRILRGGNKKREGVEMARFSTVRFIVLASFPLPVPSIQPNGLQSKWEQNWKPHLCNLPYLLSLLAR